MEIALIVMLAITAWFWLDGIRAREIAVAAGQEAAEKSGLQFLDESVAMTRLRTGRNRAGRMQLLRTYGFEVSDTGSERLPCSVTLLGQRVEHIEIPPHRDNVVRLY